MSGWVDFRMLKQSIDIEQVLGAYGIELRRVGHHQLRGLCPLPTHDSQRSRLSFSVDTAKNVWACHSASCCAVRQGRLGGNVLDLVACLEGCTIREAALLLQNQGCSWRTGIQVGEYQLASKGSSGSRSPDALPLPRLAFSLRRLRWHPYLDQRAVQACQQPSMHRVAHSTDAKGLWRADGQGLTAARTTFSVSLSRISIASRPASLSRSTHRITDSLSPIRF
jgi:hypothetical protein